MKKLLKKIADKINKVLKEMADENKKSFGGKRIDCCRLNKKK